MITFAASIIGFISGFSLLFVTSRLLKSFSLSAGFSPRTMLHIPKFPKAFTLASKRAIRLRRLWLHLIRQSIIYGIVFATAFAVLFGLLPVWQATFLALMLLTVALAGLIDLKVWLLPDFLTIPLLISGFAVSYFCQPLVTIESSIFCSVYAYILPLLTALFMQKYKENPLGGGDVKMMAALGAWLGFELFNIALVISFVFFLYLVWQRKSKVAPFGPALAPAVLVTVIGKVLLSYL